MFKGDKPVAVEQVACGVCMKEIPVTEAIVFEATDYVAHFCGLPCYDKWKSQRPQPNEPAQKPGS